MAVVNTARNFFLCLPKLAWEHVRRRLPFLAFGLWRICFPLVLVRTGRQLPVQALGRPECQCGRLGTPSQAFFFLAEKGKRLFFLV